MRFLPSAALVAASLLLASACSSADSAETATDVPPTAAAGDAEPPATPPPASTPTAEPDPTATAVPTPSATPVPTPTPLPDCVALLPDRLLVGQLLMPLATPAEFGVVADLAARHDIGSVALLGAPTVDDLAVLAGADAAAGSVGLWIASDEEGGRVQRLGAATYPIASAAVFATRSPDDVQTAFAQYGQAIADLGIDMALAPVIDVGGGPGIGDRAFSDDPAVVSAYGEAVALGYLDGGVVPVVKHFPGHGRATGDTHLGGATTPPLDELRASDLVPFVDLIADTDVAVMVGHLQVPGLTDQSGEWSGYPTSLSPWAIDGLLRAELGFDGLVLTDALGMGAISDRWNQAEAAFLAVRAGADVVILGDTNVVAPVLDSLTAALDDGTLTRARVESAVLRVFAAKGVDACVVLEELGS